MIVVNYEGGEALSRCLSSVLGQEPAPDAVLVVDNDSRDGSVDRLPDGVRLLRRGVNDGFGAAVAAGLAATDHDHVLLLNPDATLEPGALAHAVSELQRDYETGAVALRVLKTADPERIDATGIGLTSALGQVNLDHGLRDDEVGLAPRTVLGPLGGASLWRRVAIERAGGFPIGYFLYWEDMDMALRLSRAGYVCRTAPKARVLHEGGGSVGHWSARNVHYMVRNHLPCLIASLPGPVLRSRVHLALIAPIRAAVLYALRGRPLSALSGLVMGWLMIPRAYAWRRNMQRTGKQHRFAERVQQHLRDGDENRAAMKAAGVDGRSLTASRAAASESRANGARSR